MLVFSQLQFGVLQTFLTAKKQREEKEQENEMEPGEVLASQYNNFDIAKIISRSTILYLNIFLITLFKQNIISSGKIAGI